MEDKRWYDSWKISHNGDGKVEVELPNALGKNYYVFYLTPEEGNDLVNILTSAFDQMTQNNKRK